MADTTTTAVVDVARQETKAVHFAEETQKPTGFVVAPVAAASLQANNTAPAAAAAATTVSKKKAREEELKQRFNELTGTDELSTPASEFRNELAGFLADHAPEEEDQTTKKAKLAVVDTPPTRRQQQPQQQRAATLRTHPAAVAEPPVAIPDGKRKRKIYWGRAVLMALAVLFVLWLLSSGATWLWLKTISPRQPRMAPPDKVFDVDSVKREESEHGSLVDAWIWPWQFLFGSPRHDASSPVIAYRLHDTITSETCLRASPNDIRNGRLLGGKVLLHDLRTSLLWHMATSGYTAICAQHVGVPACYCLLDTRRVTPDGKVKPRQSDPTRSFTDAFRSTDGGHYMELFNPRITGLSRNRLMLVQEKNVMCQQSYWAKRFASVYVEYVDSNGDLYEKLFNGTHSYNMQHVTEIHHGMSTCSDDSADALLKLVRGRLSSPDDGEAQAMLFTSPELHRNYHPAVASPLPAPRLPDVAIGKDKKK